MLCNTLALFLLSVVAIVYGAPTGCPGGSKPGETVERGRFWYLCQEDGELAPKGCITETKSRISLSETYKHGTFVLECTLDDHKDPIFKYKGCASEDGAEHNPEDTWQDPNWWYMCTKTGEALRIDVKGCVDDGKRYNVGESVMKADLIYECSSLQDGNMGWNIYPNHAFTGTYNPTEDHIHVKVVPN